MVRKSGLDRVRLLAIGLATIGAAVDAVAQSQPTVHDVKLRPRNELTDTGSQPMPYYGNSLPGTDVKHIRTTRESATAKPPGPWPAPPAGKSLLPSDAKRIRTTHEHPTGEPLPAVNQFRPLPDRP